MAQLPGARCHSQCLLMQLVQTHSQVSSTELDVKKEQPANLNVCTTAELLQERLC